MTAIQPYRVPEEHKTKDSIEQLVHALHLAAALEASALTQYRNGPPTPALRQKLEKYRQATAEARATILEKFQHEYAEGYSDGWEAGIEDGEG